MPKTISGVKSSSDEGKASEKAQMTGLQDTEGTQAITPWHSPSPSQAGDVGRAGTTLTTCCRHSPKMREHALKVLFRSNEYVV